MYPLEQHVRRNVWLRVVPPVVFVAGILYMNNHLPLMVLDMLALDNLFLADNIGGFVAVFVDLLNFGIYSLLAMDFVKVLIVVVMRRPAVTVQHCQMVILIEDFNAMLHMQMHKNTTDFENLPDGGGA